MWEGIMRPGLATSIPENPHACLHSCGSLRGNAGPVLKGLRLSQWSHNSLKFGHIQAGGSLRTSVGLVHLETNPIWSVEKCSFFGGNHILKHPIDLSSKY